MNQQDTKRSINNLNITSEQIQLPSQNRKHLYNSIVYDNRVLKRQNEQLRKQLKSISSKLDTQIKHKISERRYKGLSKDKDESSYYQLQNAYKKCQIYKKQANFFKRRLSTIDDVGKYERYDTKMTEYMRQNEQLRAQIKLLNKTIKLQAKGLTQGGVEEYTKTIGQIERLKDQNRRYKKQLSEYRLINSRNQMSSQDGSSTVDIKAKTEGEQVGEQSYRQKLQKNNKKVRQLNMQMDQIRDINANYRYQLQQKQKQIIGLKEKIANLRKNNQLLQTQNDKNKKKDEKGRYSPQKSRVIDNSSTQYPNRSKQTKESSIQNDKNTAKSYPYRIQKGTNIQNALKWSDQIFNSKIKSFEATINQNGTIVDIHARYQKGQSKTYDRSNKKHKIIALSCSQSQFIKHIEGSFSQGSLIFLSIITNLKRKQQFGINLPNSNIFSLDIKENQYIGALFGEKTEKGINKLGCLVSHQ